MNHAADNPFLATIAVLMAAIIVWRILTSNQNKLPFVRRIPGLNAVDEAIGRATEMGRPVIFIPGVGSIGGDTTVPTLQAVSILGYIAKAVAQFGNRVIVPTVDPVLTGMVEEVVREAFQTAGRPEMFRPDDIRYLSGEQFAFASGVAGILAREKVATSLMFGPFFAESLILAEVGRSVGAFQIAGTSSRTQIPFFIATCDYVIMGDEYYAAGAYLSRNPTLLGSIVAQDYCKLIIYAIVIIGISGMSIAQHATAGSFTIHDIQGHLTHTYHYTAVDHNISQFVSQILKKLKP